MKLKFISLQEVSILSPCVFPFFPETDIIEVLLFEVIKDEAEVDTVGVEAFDKIFFLSLVNNSLKFIFFLFLEIVSNFYFFVLLFFHLRHFCQFLS